VAKIAYLRLPKGALVLLKEAARHILRRPVVGIAGAVKSRDGKWLLIRRADTGEWALPGGTLDWGETLREAFTREMLEEAGVEGAVPGKLVGVYSRPSRDPRFHGVTVVVTGVVEKPTRAPVNPLEITEVGFFDDAELPVLAFGMSDMLRDAREMKEGGVLE
jgi:8-oxo-dGTP diphosphatase